MKINVSKTKEMFRGKSNKVSVGTLNIHVEFAKQVRVITQSCDNNVVALKQV